MEQDCYECEYKNIFLTLEGIANLFRLNAVVLYFSLGTEMSNRKIKAHYLSWYLVWLHTK